MSSYSVKMRMRCPFQLRPAEALGAGSFEHVPVDVLEELLELLVGLVPGPLGDLEHLGRAASSPGRSWGDRCCRAWPASPSRSGDRPRRSRGLRWARLVDGSVGFKSCSTSSSASRPPPMAASACSSRSDSATRRRSPCCLELLLDRPSVFDQGPPEGFHRGKEPLLKARPEERRGVADPHGFVTQAAFAEGAIGVQLVRELELRRAFDRGLDENRLHLALREA